MGTEEGARIVRAWYEALERDDVDGALRLLADDAEWEMQGRTPLSGQRRGREEVRDFFATRNRLARVERFDPAEYIASGGDVVVPGVGRLFLRKTGRYVEDRWAHVFTVRDGRIVRVRLFHDTSALAAAFCETEEEQRAQTGPLGVTEPPFSGPGGMP